MKKIIFLLAVLFGTLLFAVGADAAYIESVKCSKHGVMLYSGSGEAAFDEAYKFSFIASGDTKQILMMGETGTKVAAVNQFGNVKDTVGMETIEYVSAIEGKRTFRFYAEGFDGTVTEYEKPVELYCYAYPGGEANIYSVTADKSVIREYWNGNTEAERIYFAVETSLDTRDFYLVNEKGTPLNELAVAARQRGSIDIKNGRRYWTVWFGSTILGERCFTFQAVDSSGQPTGNKVSVNFTTLTDAEYDKYTDQTEATGEFKPGTGSTEPRGENHDNKGATGSDEGVENGSDGEDKNGDRDNLQSGGTENKKGSGTSAGNCCKKEDFISIICPKGSSTLIIDFGDGKLNAKDRINEGLADKKEKEDEPDKEIWTVWVGEDKKAEDADITVYDEDYKPSGSYEITETKDFTKEEEENYSRAIENELRILNDPKQIVIKLTIGSEFMTVNGEKREVDPGRGTKPVIVSGRTLLPIRAIAEALSGSVGWDGDDRRVSILIFNKCIEMWIGKTEMRTNRVPEETDVAPAIINSRTMLPIRCVAECLNHTQVSWDAATDTVTITYNY